MLGNTPDVFDFPEPVRPCVGTRVADIEKEMTLICGAPVPSVPFEMRRAWHPYPEPGVDAAKFIIGARTGFLVPLSAQRNTVFGLETEDFALDGGFLQEHREEIQWPR